MADSTTMLAPLEKWSPRLFLVAGAVLVIYAALHRLEAFMDVAYPMVRDGIIRPIGYVLGFVALLGLYPKAVDRSPKLARAGAVFAVLGAVGWFVTGFESLAEHAGADPPARLGAFGLLILLGFVLGYLSVSVASRRADSLSRITGIMLLTPILVVVVNLVIAATGYTSPEGRFVVSSGFAVAHLAIGLSLRTEEVPTGRTEPRPIEVG